jgi:hypothetical protein
MLGRGSLDSSRATRAAARAGPRFAVAAGLGRRDQGVWKLKEFEHFKKSSSTRIQTLNLNSNNQKQCTSMNATIKSYGSLIFIRKILNA